MFAYQCDWFTIDMQKYASLIGWTVKDKNKLRNHVSDLKLPHTVSSGRQIIVAVTPAAAPAINLSKLVVSSFPENLSSCFLYVS
jgi:hypothetical protein